MRTTAGTRSATRRVLALSVLAAAASLPAGCGSGSGANQSPIVFARAPATNVFSDLYLVRTDGRLRRLTHGGIDSEPVWSPDGRRVAFERARKGRLTSLYVASVDGTSERVLRDSGSGTVHWSPDGGRLVFVDRGDLDVVDADGSGRTRLVRAAPRHADDPGWSPDGKRIVFALGFDTTGDVYVIDADGSARRRLTRLPHDAGFPESPIWSPDGRRIAFLLPGSLQVMNADGSGRKALARFPAGVFPSSPTWSPDGRTIAYARLTLGRDRRKSGIFVADADTGEVHRLTRNIDSNPSWSPDGRQLVFQRLTGFHISQITVMDRVGAGQRSLTRGGWSDTAPAWSPQA